MWETADFCRRLFGTLRPLTGSLSVDPYRFYPGSPVDRDLDGYVTRFGLHVNRPRWWEYSEQAFCSEWVDPSATLDYQSRERLTAETIGPILEMIAARFDYRGPARDYFMRSVEHARQLFHPPARLRVLADYHLWRGLTGEGNGRLAGDAEARRLLREARRASVADVRRRRCPSAPVAVVSALVDERRERYVPASHAAVSWQDSPIPLVVAGAGDAAATVSALHAYLIAFTLLGLRAGDRLLDVGGGTGYGAGAAARVVGRIGHVTTLEIDPGLSRQARRNLRHRPNVTVIQGDGRVPPCGVAFRKVLFGFALPAIPDVYIDALPEKGVIVAPVGDADGQVLTRVVRRNGRPVVSCHGPVRYVLARSVETSL